MDLARIDDALLAMRRIWAPTTSGRPARGASPTVDLSTVLLVHAVGEGEGVLTVTEAAERLGVTPTTASRLCARAVDGGYLDKVSAVADARRRGLTLTEKGRRLRRESETFRLEYLQRVLEGWTSDEVHTFSVLLSRFASVVAVNPPTPPPPFLNNEGASS
ncbi:MarR family winged helix-turn-helix transcriptional regulator [Microbacterium sp. K35]|uniref:MarR family winged helix-turn-helix transcriptional regulator n=1 Tax=Microbacterium sp. K35 TaxID=2305440 RepID=UPI00109BEDCB|nr:MarR family winged helix-turn-helix transcriptional regulator [Microbacterium sp. K35]MBN6191645.1 winged helix-turn-helix transcriptional regulator [Aneurinibacillus sp. BA2021]